MHASRRFFVPNTLFSIAATGFSSNAFARRLKAKKSGVIGIVMPRVDSPTGGKLLTGIAKAFDEVGCRTLFESSFLEMPREIKNIEHLAQFGVDGILVSSLGITDEHIALVKELKERDIPVLFIGQQHEKVRYIKADDFGAGRLLGDYIRRETGADMLLWQGSCLVHNEFKGQELAALKVEHPDAVVLVHPESPQSVIELGDVVGSTSKLLKAAVSRPEKKFIVATDLGILHEMQKQAPDKEFIAAPTAGNGGSCKSCAFCPWMAMNSLGGIKYALTSGHNEILLDRKLGEAAKLPLQRMLDFAAGLKKKDVFNGMGPA